MLHLCKCVAEVSLDFIRCEYLKLATIEPDQMYINKRRRMRAIKLKTLNNARKNVKVSNLGKCGAENDNNELILLNATKCNAICFKFACISSGNIHTEQYLYSLKCKKKMIPAAPTVWHRQFIDLCG